MLQGTILIMGINPTTVSITIVDHVGEAFKNDKKHKAVDTAK